MAVGLEVDAHVEVVMGGGMYELDPCLCDYNVGFDDILRQKNARYSFMVEKTKKNEVRRVDSLAYSDFFLPRYVYALTFKYSVDDPLAYAV